MEKNNECCSAHDLLLTEYNDLRVQRDTQAMRYQGQNAVVDELSEQLHVTKAELHAVKMNMEQHVYFRSAVLSSWSWRVTKPLRMVENTIRCFWKRSKTTKQVALRAIAYFMCTLLLHIRSKPCLRSVVTYLPTLGKNSAWRKLFAGELVFPEASKPDISIIIPVYNQREFTLKCLVSILANEVNSTYEVIVVNDCSSDGTDLMLAHVENIKELNHVKNKGFLESCNDGGAQARGEYILFLNNDTEVTPHWLDHFIATFDHKEKVGLVGAKLMYPDGRLQEAGGIIWREADGNNYGNRSIEPDHPEYNFLREVDYCSGACIMLRRDLFEQISGFDERFKPAYYEDTDLAFRIRALGKKIYYQPACQIIHYEGVSCGTDLTQGVKACQVVNLKHFKERWEKELKHHFTNETRPEIAIDRLVKKRILVADSRMIMPDQDAGSLRMFEIMKLLMELDYQVTFLPLNLIGTQPYTARLQAIGVRVQFCPHVQSALEYLRMSGGEFDVIWLSRAEVASVLIDRVLSFCRKSKIIYDTVDLHFLRELRMANIHDDKLMRQRGEERKKQELTIIRKADVTLVVSPVEKDVLMNELPDSEVQILSTIVDIQACETPFDERKNILFIGGFEHPPNVDAILYFVNEIFPLILEYIPDLVFYIIGSKAPEEIRSLESANVKTVGYIEDLDEYFNQCRLSVAPLRYGAGVKGKINSSLSYGVPVVATPIACEGMALTHEREALIADTAQEFAACVVRLYTDQKLWGGISKRGLEHENKFFSRSAAKNSLKHIISQLFSE